MIAALLTVLALTCPAPQAASRSTLERDAEIRRYVEEFQSNPRSLMQRIPPKWAANDNQAARPAPHFSAEQITSRSFVTARGLFRNQLHERSGGSGVGSRSAVWGNDRVEDLVDTHQLVRRLDDMQYRGLMSAALPVEPWSGDFWGYFKGILGARYGDPYYPNHTNWSVNYNYVLNYPANSLLYRGQAVVDSLSPSEKYDLLVGDPQGTLTFNMWALGHSYADQNGFVENWMGICEGWSAASYMVPRPLHTVTLPAANAPVLINFYPADIKALASLLWAHGNRQMRFVGGRCEEKLPAMDMNGRIVSQACFDTNPMTWHLAVVNQIGIAKRSFVLDATYDYEVWNQPVFGYKYSYFNPVTGIPSDDLRAATIPLYLMTQDKFKSYRNPNAVYVVGIAMDVTYMEETVPTQRTTDTWTYDAAKVVRYFYDLELDGNGNIVGGEWYTALHPDFLWTVPAGSRALSEGDSMLAESWSRGALPWSWRKAALNASSYGQPLAAIVENLADLATRF